MITDPMFYIAAVPAVILLGLAKGGFAGLVIVGMSLLALVINPVRAAAIMLPILMLQDIVSLWAYRRTYDLSALRILVPGAVVGTAIGALTAVWVSEAAVRALVGAVALLFSANYFLGLGRRAAGRVGDDRTSGYVWGAVSGFTSLVTHAGGPPYQIWMLPRRPEREMFAGTTTWFFAVLNLLKAPFYFGIGQLDRGALTTAAVLAPVAIASTMAGVWLVRRTPVERFYWLIHGLMGVVGVKLLADGILGVLR